MKPLSPDTTPDAQRKHYELMGRLSPEQKLSMAFALTDTMRQLVLSDLRHRFPEANDEEIRRRFIAGIRLWPPDNTFARSPYKASNSIALLTLVARA